MAAISAPPMYSITWQKPTRMLPDLAAGKLRA
jgi:hypothetical protein